MSITTKGLAGIAALGLIASAGVVAITGCSQQEPVAVVINGENIVEKTITDYVQDFRKNSSLADDKDWAQWLVDNDRNANSLREDAMDYYVRTTVIEQDAKKRNISVSEDDVTAQLNEIKEYYGYDDAQLNEQIEMIGYTPESYREYVHESLLQEKLSAALADETGTNKASDEDVLSLANTYSSVLNGSKEVKSIVFMPEDKEKAEAAQKEASAPGADFDKIAQENTTTTDYDGWNVLISLDQAVSDAIATMNKGDVSTVITGDSNLFVVKIVDVCSVSEEGFANINDIPQALREEFENNASQTAKSTQFDEYVQKLVDEAEVTRNPMPKGLPYDVSTEGISKTENSSASASNSGTQFSVDENGNVVMDENSTGDVQVVQGNEDATATNTEQAPSGNAGGNQ